MTDERIVEWIGEHLVVSFVLFLVFIAAIVFLAPLEARGALTDGETSAAPTSRLAGVA